MVCAVPCTGVYGVGYSDAGSGGSCRDLSNMHANIHPAKATGNRATAADFYYTRTLL